MAEAQKNPCIQMMEHLTFIKDLPTRKKPEVKRRAVEFDDLKMLKKLMAGNECCQRLAYYGMMSTNLVNYLHDRFGLGNGAAANAVTTWWGDIGQ
ncbi:hypothetical protein Ahy_B02g061075 [Arachis hypogaea]|uniref:Uncharacterized protein n=1 Tax=Arachis hypogaea TaxID=3818 RepID=A0A445AK69_ARAHY|nr:hypothetical protein Ahy_B02g061075 [Arachis hypogaea]